MRASRPKINLLAAVVLVMLSGCAITNQGAVDYRFKRPGTDDGLLSPKYISADTAKHILKAGDPISITLKQVFIKNLTEWRSPLRLVRGEPATGDVAIVASTCETPCVRKFGSDGVRSSKVIFYSNDVREKQYLSISNLNGVYGPITYNGNPFKLDIYIIELDENGEQVREMLGSLASLGETFYPPAHPAATILSALADTFIQDDQDDNVFTYSFDLIGQKTSLDSTNPNTGHLETGDYILVRSENRETSPPWDTLAFNQSTGRVVKKEKEGNCETALEPSESCYYKDNSYIVLEINKAEGAIINDSQQMVFSALKDQLAGDAGSMQITSQKISSIKDSLESSEARNNSKSYIASIKNSAAGTAERRTSVLNFVSVWFDKTSSVTAKDKVLVIEQTNGLLGKCKNLTATEVSTYQDEVKNRTLTNKASFISALETCHS